MNPPYKKERGPEIRYAPQAFWEKTLPVIKAMFGMTLIPNLHTSVKIKLSFLIECRYIAI
jgi:hypothetical protein